MCRHCTPHFVDQETDWSVLILSPGFFVVEFLNLHIVGGLANTPVVSALQGQASSKCEVWLHGGEHAVRPTGTAVVDGGQLAVDPCTLNPKCDRLFRIETM